MAVLLFAVMAVSCSSEADSVGTGDQPESTDVAPQSNDGDSAGEESGTVGEGVDQGQDNGNTEVEEAITEAEKVRDGYGRPPVGDEQSIVQQSFVHPEAVSLDEVEVFGGTLRLDEDLESCFVLEVSGHPYGLVWVAEELEPHHPVELLTHWARLYDDGSPADLLTADGTVLNRDGDEIELDGQVVPNEELGSSYLPCAVGDETLVVSHPDTPDDPEVYVASDRPGVTVQQAPSSYPGIGPSVGNALIEGTLVFDQNLDGGCFVLESNGETAAVLWTASGESYGLQDTPESWPTLWTREYDDGRPAELVYPNGQVVATDGDRVEFGGGLVQPGQYDRQDFRCAPDDGEPVLSIAP